MAARLATPPERAVLLVATSAAVAAAGDGASADALADAPPLGVCELSLSPETRTFEDRALMPPPHGAYIKNMSVAAPHRRAGVATALLQAAEAYAAAAAELAAAAAAAAADAAAAAADAAGADPALQAQQSPPRRQYAPPLEMYLHVAVGDAGASSLYRKGGYASVAEQSALMAALRRSGPRVALMRKRLRD